MHSLSSKCKFLRYFSPYYLSNWANKQGGVKRPFLSLSFTAFTEWARREYLCFNYTLLPTTDLTTLIGRVKNDMEHSPRRYRFAPGSCAARPPLRPLRFNNKGKTRNDGMAYMEPISIPHSTDIQKMIVDQQFGVLGKSLTPDGWFVINLGMLAFSSSHIYPLTCIRYHS